MHQCYWRFIAHGDPVQISHRQCEARALKQRACRSHVDEGDNSWRDAALDLGLGCCEGLPQLEQSVAARECCEQQSVWLEGTADLYERARQIIDELKREGRYEEIKRSVAEWQCLLVHDNCKTASLKVLISYALPQAARGRSGCHDRADLAASSKLPTHGIGWRAEVDRPFEAPEHCRKAIGQILRHTFHQKSGRTQGRRAQAAAAQQATVKNNGLRR